MSKLGPSKNTRPELLLFSWLEEWGIPFVRHAPETGSPDALAGRIALFVDGRHWHHPPTARRHHKPHHATDWTAKALRNQARDYRVNRILREQGFRVVRIWDSSLTGKVRTERTKERLLRELRARRRLGTVRL